MLVSPSYETFTLLSSEIYFSLPSSLTISYCHDNNWATFQIFMMSGPELLYLISSSEEALLNILCHEEALACLRRITDDLRELRLGLNKLTSKKTVVSSYMDPDPSSGLNYGGVISKGFCGPSNHQRDQIMLWNFNLKIQPQAVPVSDFSILTKPTYRKTVV